MSQKLTVVVPDVSFQEIMEKTLVNHTLDGLCGVAVDTENPPVIHVMRATQRLESFAVPLRMGSLLDRIRYHAAMSGHIKHPDRIGDYYFDYAQKTLLNTQNATTTRLTDKEADIIEALVQTRGAILDRQTLLDRVWGYAAGVETHTLETHIYRLRQKIEKDPAQPAYIITDGNGYRLAGLS